VHETSKNLFEEFTRTLLLSSIGKSRLKLQIPKPKFLMAIFITGNPTLNHPKVAPENAKRPPGNRAASSLGRIVPTEAKPSELSGEILSLAK
jgi:hypothetical protein